MRSARVKSAASWPPSASSTSPSSSFTAGASSVAALELLHGGRELGRGAPVGDGHLGPARAGDAGRGDAAPREPHDEHALSCEAKRVGHRYLSLSEASATSASMMDMIQKRTMIFGSAQPFSSKWWWMGAILNTRRPVVR